MLLCIKQNNGISQTDIARRLALSKPITSEIVSELIEEGWVNEECRVEKNSPNESRLPALFFSGKSQYIVGIDIGGTNVELAIVDLEGKVLAKTSFSTRKYLAINLLEKLIESIQLLLREQNLSERQLLGVGIGVPGITNVEEGVVIDAPTLGWRNYPLRQVLSEKLSVPIYVDNDVNVSVMGERWQGLAVNKQNVLKIMIGTGVGCGMILKGELYRGSSYAAGEIGYMVTDKTAIEKGYPSVFTKYGFLDNHIGGAAIARQMKDLLGTDTFEGKEITAIQVFELARKKNAEAHQVVAEMIRQLTLGLINVIALFNPDCIVIGGGVSKSLDTYLPKIKASIQENIPVDCQILFSHHENISVLGAANLVLVEHDSIFNG